MPDEPATSPALRLFNRDLSWLAFNERVLFQAGDARLPLLERVKFCAIHSGNLDEFVMKRVGLARWRLENTPAARSDDGMPVAELLARMREIIRDQQERLASMWAAELVPALAQEGIRIRRHAELSPAESAAMDQWFEARVFPILTPLAVDPAHPFPFISNLSENLAVMLRRPGEPAGPRVFARLKIPTVVPRFVPVAPGGAAGPIDSGSRAEFDLLPLDQLIAANLDRLFPGMTVDTVSPFRVTRSAAVEAEEDSDDLLEQIEDELRRRKFAEAVRLEVPPDADPEAVQVVATNLDLPAQDVYARGGPLEYEDLFEIASLPRPDLRQQPWTPCVHPRLRGLPELPRSARDRARSPGPDSAHQETIFDRIRAGDILLHHPYDSFTESVERFIAEAARDPRVLAIKQTIYRTSPGSPFVRSLAEAADEGKNVAALVEVRARFDEERNLTFARHLELSGVHVAHGVHGLKTHCKLSLVVREEDGGLRAYAHIGTGNYHPKTAQLYTDLGLLTADPVITAGVSRLFNTLTGHAQAPEDPALLIAPRSMRQRFAGLIDAEAEHARAGRPARILAKMNQLEDPGIIERLYAASRAGVDIRLYVRGFCCLVPGLPGLSENIRVHSLVGRFLEHARLFYFAAGSTEPADGEYIIGSADWMSRNLNDRVEVAVRVTDPASRAKLRRVLEVMESDTRNAWALYPDGSYARRMPPKGEPEIGTFATLMADAMA